MSRASVFLVVCALGLTGCGAVTDPDDVSPDVYVEPPAVADAALETFGEGEVEQAFDEITTFCLEEGFPAELVGDPRQRTYTAAELAGDLDTRLTTDALAVWQELTAAAADGDQAARQAVQVMRFFDIEEPDWQPAPEEDPVVRQQITGATVGVATPGGEPVVEVAFDHTATLQYLDETDTPVQADVRKDLTFHLTPAPGGEDWLIAAFDGDYSFPTAEQEEPD